MPSNKKRAVSHGYKLVEVSAFDLARLLDWSGVSTIKTQGGKRLSITDVAWFADAYRSVDRDFYATITTGWRACP